MGLSGVKVGAYRTGCAFRARHATTALTIPASRHRPSWGNVPLATARDGDNPSAELVYDLPERAAPAVDRAATRHTVVTIRERLAPVKMKIEKSPDRLTARSEVMSLPGGLAMLAFLGLWVA